MGHIPTGPGGQIFSKCMDTLPLLDGCHVPYQSGDRGHEYRLVLAQATSPVFTQLSGRGWCWRRNKDRYNDRYQASGVRQCRVIGVACAITIRLLVGTEWSGKGSMGRPSQKGLGRDRGSVTRTCKANPRQMKLEIPKFQRVRKENKESWRNINCYSLIPKFAHQWNN